MTPVQYWLYTSAGMSTDLAIKMSFATTLAVVLPTAASGAWQHHRQGGINWKAATFMGIFTSIAGFLGASIAARLPGSALKIAFGAVALAVGIRMVTVRISDVERPIRENRWLYIGLAVPIGLITGILGIGGGIFIVPILVLLLGYRMRYAVGTSLGIMLFTSAGAIIGYIVNGLNTPAGHAGPYHWLYLLAGLDYFNSQQHRAGPIGCDRSPQSPRPHIKLYFCHSTILCGAEYAGSVHLVVQSF